MQHRRTCCKQHKCTFPLKSRSLFSGMMIEGRSWLFSYRWLPDLSLPILRPLYASLDVLCTTPTTFIFLYNAL